jgi:hypothetical protein
MAATGLTPIAAPLVPGALATALGSRAGSNLRKAVRDESPPVASNISKAAPEAPRYGNADVAPDGTLVPRKNAYGNADIDPATGELVPRRARGGPVLGGRPYLVGEEGPEIIVPDRKGHVLTAEETRDLKHGDEEIGEPEDLGEIDDDDNEPEDVDRRDFESLDRPIRPSDQNTIDAMRSREDAYKTLFGSSLSERDESGRLTRSDERTKTGMRDSPMADAMRSMEPSSYEYKPQFAGAEGQRPGEKNVGPMADKMKKDPVAGTAIIEDPKPPHLLAIDKSKGLKLALGGLSDLQRQIDQMKRRSA